jgi:Mn2+/Fe2+ NRAMP family transporter
MGSALLKFLYAPLLVIIGLLVANKSILDDLSAPFEIEVFVIIVFLVCFGFNTYIIFRSHYRRLNTSQQEGVDINRNNLEKDFDNL